MTSNERKILKCLWDAKGRAHVKVVSENIGITADYTRLLCRSLARAGYLKFADTSVCYLLTRGRNRFQKNDELAPEELSKASQVILASSAQILSGDGDDSYDKEDVKDKDESGGQAVNDGDLDRALASISSPASRQSEETKEKGEEGEIEKEEEKKEEGVDAGVESLQTELEEETKTAENIEQPSEEPKISTASEPEEKAQVTAILEETPQAVLASTTTLPERTAEVEEEKKAEPQEIDKTEARADNPAPAAPLESHEKAVPKEESAKPSGGFGVSFKKIVNWFAEKK